MWDREILATTREDVFLRHRDLLQKPNGLPFDLLQRQHCNRSLLSRMMHPE